MTDTASPQFIEIGTKPLTAGRDKDAAIRLAHPTVSRCHATLTRDAQGIAVVDHDSRYGTFLNGVRVRTGLARMGDRLQFGTNVIYRVEANGLRIEPVGQGLAVAACGLDIADRKGKLIVSDISFEIASDSFVGLLAPSGVGKSTVLNCAAGYFVPVRGQLQFDGPRDVYQELDAYQNSIGYVTQEDVIHSALSVRENLSFSARLRFGEATDAPQVIEAVNRAMEGVDLAQHASTLAGLLSGGERKRLSVAIELLKRPRLLLLDEPTSGLDPAMEAKLMEDLRHITRQGTTVLCTTHLMDNMSWFDQVVVLGKSNRVGRVAYCGQPSELLRTFGCRTYADLYERLQGGQFEPLATLVADQAPRPTIPPPSGIRGARVAVSQPIED